MRIVKNYPPNYSHINATFNIRNRPGLVFTYGDILYNPSGNEIPQHLLRHEETHMRQQGDSITAWWNRYITNIEFRLEQEVEAYRAQYRYLIENYNRGYQKQVLKQIVKDLSSNIYGKIVSQDMALMLITTT